MYLPCRHLLCHDTTVTALSCMQFVVRLIPTPPQSLSLSLSLSSRLLTGGNEILSLSLSLPPPSFSPFFKKNNFNAHRAYNSQSQIFHTPTLCVRSTARNRPIKVASHQPGGQLDQSRENVLRLPSFPQG